MSFLSIILPFHNNPPGGFVKPMPAVRLGEEVTRIGMKLANGYNMIKR